MNATGFQRLKAFGRSPHHAWLALVTLGGGLATAQLPLLGIAAALYGLGWIYLTDSQLFKRWLSSRLRGNEEAEHAKKIDEVRLALSKLPKALRAEYEECSAVAAEILAHPSLETE